MRPMFRTAVLGVAIVAASLAQLVQAQPRQLAADPNQSYSYRILNAPTSSDERAIRTLGLQPEAQALSNKLFNTLASLLGGSAPGLNFVPTGSPLLSGADTSANIKNYPGGPQGTINVDPLAVDALINNGTLYHSWGVTQYPHEMAHLHQTPQTLASLLTREGGAQSFADAVTPTAAKQAGIPYTPDNYDGSYAPLVQQVQSQLGRNWILFSQFGRPTGTWP